MTREIKLALVFVAVALAGMGCADETAALGSHSATAETDDLALADNLAETGVHARPLLQVGPWYPTPWNYEEPFINIIRASSVAWRAGDVNTQALYDAGHINPDTGLPVSMPRGEPFIESDVYFAAPRKSYYDGKWVLEWEGDADIEMNFTPFESQWRANKNRLEITRNNKTQFHASIKIRELGPGGITALRLYREENESLLKAGRIFNPRFVDAVSRGDIVRTMDIQEANRTGIRSVDDLATMETAFWNNITWAATNGIVHKRMSAPLEAVVALAVEADVALWHHAPATLGAPKSFRDPTIDSDLKKYIQMAENNVEQILASPAWDEYADHFVSALEARGYPETRTLYTTIDNEVWNYAVQYQFSTEYANGIGRGLNGGEYQIREGYGALLARWKMALDASLARAGRSQKVVYVVESQAATPYTTTAALTQMKKQIEKSRSGAWKEHASAIGVSIASYWGGRCWYHIFDDVEPKSDWPFTDDEQRVLRSKWQSEMKRDPEGLAKRLADCNIDGPEELIATKDWVLKRFAQHNQEAAKFGLKVIGAYEGGSHETEPKFFWDRYGTDKSEFTRFYKSYLWGPEGGRVNQAVNDALVEAYPDIILSNYVLIGDTGVQPWFDGLYDENNPMQQSWEKYERRH